MPMKLVKPSLTPVVLKPRCAIVQLHVPGRTCSATEVGTAAVAPAGSLVGPTMVHLDLGCVAAVPNCGVVLAVYLGKPVEHREKVLYQRSRR